MRTVLGQRLKDTTRMSKRSLTLADNLGGNDGSRMLGIIFTGAGEGEFYFRIDDLRLLKEAP